MNRIVLNRVVKKKIQNVQHEKFLDTIDSKKKNEEVMIQYILVNHAIIISNNHEKKYRFHSNHFNHLLFGVGFTF